MPQLLFFGPSLRPLSTSVQNASVTGLWAEFLQVLHRTGRILRFLGRCPTAAEPCVGLGGLRAWAEASGVPYKAHECYDLELQDFYGSLQARGARGLEKVHTGPEEGDVQRLHFSKLMDCEILLSGPPCQPFCKGGARKGSSDCRSDVLESVVSMVMELAWRGSLVAFVIENSSALPSHEYFGELLRRLECTVPFFRMEVVRHNLKDLVPHQRERAWLRGLRTDCLDDVTVPGLPPAASAMQMGTDKLTLESYLEEGAPPTDPATLTTIMQANLSLYKDLCAKAHKASPHVRVFAVELDRNPLKNYGGCVSEDCIPPLRTGGPKVFLLSAADIGKCWKQMKLHRFLLVSERFALQGHSPESARDFRGKSAAVKAAGNAFNVLAMASMLTPLLESAARNGVLQRGGIVKRTTAELLQLDNSFQPQQSQQDQERVCAGKRKRAGGANSKPAKQVRK